MKSYDVVIIGAGAAGMSAAIYAKRAGKSVVVLEKYFAGGQMLTIDKIENFPSAKLVDGVSLSMQMSDQLASLGVEVLTEEVVECDLLGDKKIVKTHKNEYTSKSVILATGARPKMLNAKHEKDFLGRGVSYCAICDGKFFEGKDIGVVGTIDTAKEDIIYLNKLAKSIVFISSKNQPIEGVETIVNSQVIELVGDHKLRAVKLENLQDKSEREIELDALFIELGKSPDLSIFKQKPEVDKNGFIITDEKMRTSIPGLFAVGDVRNGALKQIVTACSDGAIAATFA